MEDKGEKSVIGLFERPSDRRSERETSGEMSVIWLAPRSSTCRFTQYRIPVRSEMPLLTASSFVSVANSDFVMSPVGLPKAALMAASRFSSGKVTVSESVAVGVGMAVGVGVGVGVVIGVGVGEGVGVGGAAGVGMGEGVGVGSAPSERLATDQTSGTMVGAEAKATSSASRKDPAAKRLSNCSLRKRV